ncbi:MAG: DNA repair protein RecO [Myxococcota bacterium]
MRAIIAGGVDVGDHDRLVRVLTPDQGRTAVLVRGVRGGRKNHLSTAITPGAHVDLELRKGRGPLPLLRDAQVLASPNRARTDLLRLSQLSYGVEVCSELAPEHHEAERLFKLLLSWLACVEGDEPPGAATRQALEAKALTFAGMAPSLVACAVCGDRLEDPTVFSFDAGGGCHGRCAQGRATSAAALVRLEALRRTALAQTVGVAPVEPSWLLGDAVEWNLGRGMKSRSMLEEVEDD